MNRKRQKFYEGEEEEDSDLLKLSLSLPSSTLPLQPKLTSSSSTPTHHSSSSMQAPFSQSFPQTPLQLSPTHTLFISPPLLPYPPLIPTTQPGQSPSPSPIPIPNPSPSSRPVRNRRNPSHAPTGAKSETVPIPFPWATNRRAIVHSLDYLRERQILTITGKVQCKTCENSYDMGFDLESKFAEVSSFIARNRYAMHDRAPNEWVYPILPACKNCGNSIRPVVSERKRSINWLFLLLGQMLGCCTLEQLKYFCKHAKIFRTGAKDRILYLTYLGLCKQLDPTGPFDIPF